MSILSASGKWKSIEVAGNLLEKDKEFEFLGGIEELNDYDLTNGTETNKKAKKTKKRALDSKTEDDVKPKKRKKKKNKKLEKKTATTKEPSEIDSNHKNVESADSDLPGTSLSEWDNLCLPEPILKALSDLNFTSPTEVQKLSLEASIRDRLDVIGAAETGSGKTLAFGIPIVCGLLKQENEKSSLRALILAPTRELALQVKDHMTAITKYTKIQIAAVIGGLSVQKQERLLKRKPEILVATPGRLWALMQEMSDSGYLSDLKSIQYLVVDETDRMVEKGHFEELTEILDKINCDEHRNPRRQTLVFSATLTYVHPAPRRLTKTQMQQMSVQDKIDNLISLTGVRKEHRVIDITRDLGTAQTLTETRINCANLQQKDAYLCYFVHRYPGRTLVFTNSIDCARRVYGLLNKLGINTFLLHAKMHQKQRLKNLERFSAQSECVLLSTDVAARGLDIKGIQHVVHYQIPKTAEVYVHRSGRTARALNEGLSLMLVDTNDAAYYRRICNNLNRDKDLQLLPMDNPKLLEQLKGRVELAAAIDSVEHKLKKTMARNQWFRKAAEDVGIDFEHVDVDQSMQEASSVAVELNRELKGMQKKLKILSSEPLALAQTIETRYPTFEMVQDYGSQPMDALDSVKAHKTTGKQHKSVFKKKLKVKKGKKRKN